MRRRHPRAGGCSMPWPPRSAFAASGKAMRARRRCGWKRLPRSASASAGDAATEYPFVVSRLTEDGLIEIDPAPMWHASSTTSTRGVPASRHRAPVPPWIIGGAGRQLPKRLDATGHGRALFNTVALSGGCFQNRILFESVAAKLRDGGIWRADPCRGSRQ